MRRILKYDIGNSRQDCITCTRIFIGIEASGRVIGNEHGEYNALTALH
jgi:hypothetical protein